MSDHTYLDNISAKIAPLFSELPFYNQSEAQVNITKSMVALGVMAGLLLSLRYASGQIKSFSNIEKRIIPPEKPTFFGVVDFIFEKITDFYDQILGGEQNKESKENRREHLPLVVGVFLFIFLSNLIGLIPGAPSATTTVWVNVSLAFVVFCYFNWQGIKANGLIGYLKHFMGPIWWLAPLIFVVEIVSTCIRILTLNLRLYWNIKADHIVLGAFTGLVKYVVPAAFYALGTFVAFMQAFVFTTLTMVYILLATSHSSEEHH
ncbi:MAG TPA: F0F1 ATP synthase subunit A [Oligoflexia bacterium]|nr:F0F1 ATP synthase subunit A [Oligoflexia bacterium]HMP26897.1 F0F1 ATP synthase subunit A [Oligoflexia bacterium]